MFRASYWRPECGSLRSVSSRSGSLAFVLVDFPAEEGPGPGWRGLCGEKSCHRCPPLWCGFAPQES